MQTQEPKFTKETALEFSEELWGKVKENGFGAWGKNDIYDYLLYLFNKHGGGFFDANSNEQNERLLKTTATKIKASKKNIAVKFMDDGEYGDILKVFWMDFINKKIPMEASDDNQKIELTIENKVVRDILNARLKANGRAGLDLPNFNTEKVKMSGGDFVAILESEANDLPRRNGAQNSQENVEKLELALGEAAGKLNEKAGKLKTRMRLQDFFTMAKNAPQDYGMSFVEKVVLNIYDKFYGNK